MVPIIANYQGSLSKYIEHRKLTSDLIAEAQNPPIFLIAADHQLAQQYWESRTQLEQELRGGTPFFMVLRTQTSRAIYTLVSGSNLTIAPHPLMTAPLLLVRDCFTRILERIAYLNRGSVPVTADYYN